LGYPRTPCIWLFEDVKFYERPVEFVLAVGQQDRRNMHFTPGHPDYEKEKQTCAYY